MPVGIGLHVLVALVAATVLVMTGPGMPDAGARVGTAGKLEALGKDIEGAERRIGKRRARERVLTGDIRRYDMRISALQRRISGLELRERSAREQLARSTEVLDRTQRQLRAERRRLVALRARLVRAKRVLAARLVELYQADKPDLVGVVVSSRGFIDLLERAEFLNRIRVQDRRVMAAVRRARAEAIATERRLAGVERAQRRAAERIEASRRGITRGKARLVDARGALESARGSRTVLLRSVRVRRESLESDLASMRREESRIRARLRRAVSSRAAPRPTVPTMGGGSGKLVWPVDGQFTSPFGQRWGRLHAGIDIAVPTGTPVRAAGAGTVAISGWTGGYGNYVCIALGGGLSACGAHNSQLKVRVGQRVAKGQVVALSGNTGNSTGPHVHFETRLGGVPRDPMSYL